jgi:hypothetical protein
MEHFLLKCTILRAVRYSVLDDIDIEFNKITGKTFYNLDSYLKIQILLYIEILVVSTVLIITYLYTQDCHDSAIQNSQGEFVSLDSYPDYRTFFQLFY